MEINGRLVEVNRSSVWLKCTDADLSRGRKGLDEYGDVKDRMTNVIVGIPRVPQLDPSETTREKEKGRMGTWDKLVSG